MIQSFNKIHPIDLLIIFAYLGFTLYLGIGTKDKKITSISHYLLGGRKLTLPAFVATLVSTWYGGILGVGEFSYRYGISNWLVFGVPYYLAAFLFAIFLAKRTQNKNLYTIPQQIDIVYGRTPSLVAALFVFFLTTPAPYVLMLGLVLQFFFPMPLWLCIIIGAAVSTIYIYVGGFHSVVNTNIFQFILMFGGFIAIIIYSYFHFGGIDFLKTNLPSSHFTWHGGQGADFIIVWYFVALATLIEPAFYQRCFAADSPTVAQRGVLISILFWIFFDFLTTTAGLYARALLPELGNPATAYLQLAIAILPPVFLGLFFVALLATIMSTVESYTFLAAITFGRDYLWRFSKIKEDDIVLRYTKIGLLFTTLVSIIIAILGESVIHIWKVVGSIATPTLLFPVISSFWPRLNMRSNFVILTMITGGIVSVFWMLLKESSIWFHGNFPLKIQPIYAGLSAAFLIVLVDFASRPVKKS